MTIRINRISELYLLLLGRGVTSRIQKSCCEEISTGTSMEMQRIARTFAVFKTIGTFLSSYDLSITLDLGTVGPI